MKIEEITNLRKQELNNELRRPKGFKQCKNEEEELFENEKQNTLACVVTLTQNAGVVHNFVRPSTVLLTAIRSSSFVNSFRGLGVPNCPYKIDCKLGKGQIISARTLFKNKTYPEYLEKNHCFSNAMFYSYFLAKENKEAKLVSGIFDVGIKPVLHSVVEIPNYKDMGDCVVDFNYDLVMTKDLYYKLFNFEKLSSIDANRFIEDKVFAAKNKNILGNINVMYLNFAYEDMLDFINDKDRQNKNIEFLM